MPMSKEEKSAYDKERYEKNKEKRKEQRKEHYQNNKEKIIEQNKIYNQTPNGKKSIIIKSWKHRGIKSDNYDTLYDNYLKSTNCEECGIPFGKRGDGSGLFKCCDHDHETGEFRNFLCNTCNLKRG